MNGIYSTNDPGVFFFNIVAFVLKFRYKKWIKPFGLKNNYISSIIYDEKENLWVASNSGLSYLDTQNKFILHFDKDFSINQAEFIRYSSLSSTTNKLFFGNPYGFYAFNSSEPLSISQLINSPLFTNLYVANKKISVKPTDKQENRTSFL